MKKLPTPCSTSRSGFTILELAVTVIIIAVIAVVALPMYKHAILKSRFSTVMPMAKAVADAQEIYYLGNNQYALGKEDLDIAPVEAENTQVSLSPAEEDEEYIYVAAHRTDIPNVRYIMYQKNSPKFASNIHCEADANDEDALWLCEKALHGTEVTGSLQGKQYKTFLLAGELGGSSFKVCPENAVCNDEGNVTGCEGGYYQEEQTCKEEKACDESKKTIRTACAEDCGEEIKEGTCNVKTGQWENYTVTQACPKKPDTEKACSELGKGWTSGTATREVKCEGNAWTEPEWDEEPCQKSCTKPQVATKACSGCGTQTAETVTCDTKEGEWKYDNWSECPKKPDESIACAKLDSTKWQSGTATRISQCQENTWSEPAWNESGCVPVCPANSTCNSTGQVTGCVSGYYMQGGICVVCPGNKVATCDKNGKLTSCVSGYYVKNGACAVMGNYNYAGNSVCSGTGTKCTGKTFGDDALCTDNANCQGSSFYGNSSCNGATCNFTPMNGGVYFTDNARCTGNAACAGAAFSGNSVCTSTRSSGCSGSGITSTSSFSDNAVCAGSEAAGCKNATYSKNACCAGTSSSCPAGVQKCVYDATTKTYIRSGTW